MCRLGLVTFQLFINPRVPAYSGAFFLADQRGMAGFPKSVRFEPPNVIEILKLPTMRG